VKYVSIKKLCSYFHYYKFITEFLSGFIITHSQLEIHATTPAVLIMFLTSVKMLN